MKSSKTPKLNTFALFLLFLSICPSASGEVARQNAVVENALSGDTVKLKGGKVLRYIGLEAHPIQSQIALAQQYGQEALEFNRQLVEGKAIMIEWGPQLRDKKGRLLGYVFLNDGLFVNREILKKGHAKLKLVAPNTRYAEEFRNDELTAKRSKTGLWVKEPDDPRIQHEILGNKVSKIYYYPNSPELSDVRDSELVRFRSRVEAVAAGYKPCYSCRNSSVTDDTESP